LNKFKQLSKFTKGASLASKDADELAIFETENDKKSKMGLVFKILGAVAVLALGGSIIYSNLSLIGTQKSQKSEFSSNNVLTYPMDHLAGLVELKLYANMTTKSVFRLMDFLVSGDEKASLRIGREKCESLHADKSESQEICEGL
jgi:hypothetical protein